MYLVIVNSYDNPSVEYFVSPISLQRLISCPRDVKVFATTCNKPYLLLLEFHGKVADAIQMIFKVASVLYRLSRLPI